MRQAGRAAHGQAACGRGLSRRHGRAARLVLWRRASALRSRSSHRRTRSRRSSRCRRRSSRSTHARVIDGTGAPAREDQTIVIRDGNIAAIGDAARTAPPAGATIVDLTGKSVIPGLVMLHEHLYYTTGPGVYGQLGVSFSRLYLAGGVTTMRTAGNVNGIMDINVAPADRRGRDARPRDRRDGAVRERPEHVPADARGRERRRGAHARRVLGRSGRDLAQGLHADLARGAQGRDRRRRTGAG